MASGSDARVGVAVETTYGTRVAPARFLPLTTENLTFEPNRYVSPAIGIGRWAAPSIITTKGGSGSIAGDVTTTGMGYILQGLHNNSVTPVQQGATPAYLQTHTLDTGPNKSFSFQVQTPPVTSAVLVPHDLLGVVFGGITFSWSPGGVLSYEIPAVVRDLDLSQSLATYTAPSAYDLLPFSGGTLTVGGVAEANIVGDGSVEIGYSLRDDAYALGTTGLMAKPVETAKPTAVGNFTADFVDNANITRTLNDTQADVVLKFEGATISGAHKFYVEVTLPDCKFTTNRPTVDGPGPVQSAVSFTASSSTNDPPVVKVMSTDTTL